MDTQFHRHKALQEIADMPLNDLLAEQQQQLEGFLATLGEERDCLSEGQVNGERLAAIAQRKQAQLTRVDELESQRREQQQAAGYGNGKQGAEQFAQSQEANAAWSQVRETAEKVRQLNQLNGHGLSQRLSHNQQAIDFLERAVGGNVYGPSGLSQAKNFGGINSQA